MKNQNPKNFIMDLSKHNVPKLRYNEDKSFENWQKEAREKLGELLGLDNIVECEHELEVMSVEDCATYTDTYFRFQSEPGYFVACHMLKPKNVEGKIPALICLQGHSKGMHISIGKPIFEGDEEVINAGDRNYAQLAVMRGYCAIALEQRYMGECGGTEDGPGCLSRDSTEVITALPALLFGRTAIGERVHDVSAMVDLIEQNAKNLFAHIDTEDIMLTGNSGGGTTTFYAACMDERIKYAIPSCSVCTYEDSITSIHHCGCNYIPSIAKYFDMCDLAGLIAPRGLVIAAGKEDVIFPIDGVKRTFEFAKGLYKFANAENCIDLVIGDEGHRYYAKPTFEALERIREYKAV